MPTEKHNIKTPAVGFPDFSVLELKNLKTCSSVCLTRSMDIYTINFVINFQII